ncbi:MAG: hypothetical protein ACYDHN_13130 [Solirubrobacteraceae bacterium]
MVLAAIQQAEPSSGAKEIVLAIVGGTMLTLALTRPNLKWVARLTEDSESQRIWAERGLTLFAFIMGGYAWATLFLTLQRQLGTESAALLKGAACLLILYALLVHFEPFVAEWRLRGGLATFVLYFGCATSAASIGVTTAEVVRTSSIRASDISIPLFGIAMLAICTVFYLLIPHIDSTLERAIEKIGEPSENEGA